MNFESTLEISFLFNKSVFLTGATGFVGKAVLELLLKDHRSHINQIYLLIRASKKKDVKERFEELMTNKIFTNIQDAIGIENYWSMIESKVIPIEGDISLPNLGINDCNLKLLKKNVNYVIHCAATTGFDGNVQTVFNLNVVGTQFVMELCDQLDCCLGFQHVSTAYTNSNLPPGDILERVYPMEVDDPLTLINSIPKMNEIEIEALTKKALKIYPNTYIFTKSLSEHNILNWIEFMRKREIENGVPAWPICIIRPTIVTSSAHSPVPGWTDGITACNGVILFTGLGILDTFPGDPNTTIDLVPVDYLAHMMIKACAIMSPPGTKFALPFFTESNLGSNLPLYPIIYHAASSNIHPVKSGQIGKCFVKGCKRLPPLKRQLFSPKYNKYDMESFNTFAFALRTYMRFGLISTFALFKDPKKLKKIQFLKSKLDFLNDCFRHFWENGWIFKHDNVEKLDDIVASHPLIGQVESTPFPATKLKEMSWERYIYQWVWGLYYFVLQESPSLRLIDVIPGWECTLKKAKPLPNTDETGSEIKPIPSFESGQSAVINKKIGQTIIDDEIISNCIHLITSQIGLLSDQVDPGILKGITSLKGSRSAYKSSSHHFKVEKLLKQSFSRLLINQEKMIRVQCTLAEFSPCTRIIYIPTHYSSIDGLILCNVLSEYNLPVPEAIAEGNNQLVSYSVLNLSTLLKKRPLNIKQLESPTLRNSIIVAYLSQVLKMGGSIALFLDPSPIDDNSDDNTENPSLLSTLIESIKRTPNFGPVSIVPITLNYEMIPDRNYLIQECCSPTSCQRKEKIPLQPPSKVGSGYINIDEPISISSLFDVITNDSTCVKSPVDEVELQVRNIHLQAQIISPTNLLAAILIFFKAQHEDLIFYHCRALMRYFRNHILTLGYYVDWTDEEDASAVLHHTIEMIGSDHIAIISLDKSEIIKVTKSLNTGILLELLAKPIASIITIEGIWYAAYILSHMSSQSKFVYDSNESAKLPNPSQSSNLPTKSDVLAKFITLTNSCRNTHPSLVPNLSRSSIEHHFNYINNNLHAQGLIMTKDESIVPSSDTFPRYYLNMCLYFVNPGFYSINGTWLSLSASIGSHTIPHSKLSQRIDDKKYKDYTNFQLYPDNDSKPNMKIGLQVLNWWTSINEVETNPLINL